jgi:hypothetical protein
MEILINGEALEIMPGFSVEIEEYNPFFSEVGAQSLPVQLPYSAHNLALFGHPERIAHTYKLVLEYEAIIRHGFFHRRGKLVLFSASKSSGIDCTFYMNEGELYSMIKDRQLSDIDFSNYGDYNPDPYSGDSAEKAEGWLQHFEDLLNGRLSDSDYYLFPVCTSATSSGSSYVYEYLNELDLSSLDVVRLVGHSERLVNDVVCPVGYGVTPMLLLNRFLRVLFASFGYDLKSSLFDTDDDLRQIVLLNNNADSICAGKLDYRQLVPSCSIGEFLDTIRNKFCCEFVSDGGSKSVEVRFFESPSTLSPDMDLSGYIVDCMDVSHESFKQLKLSGGTGIAFAQPAGETLEEVLLESLFSSAVDEVQFLNISSLAFGEVVLRKSTGQFYKKTSADGKGNLTPIGSSFFNYDKKTDGLSYEERTSGDEQTPLIMHSFGWASPIPVPCVGSRRHLNTGIKNGVEITEDKSGSCPVMYCYGNGRSYGVPFGSPFCYDATGGTRGSLSLQYAGIEGLFIRFWKTYDSLLRHAFRKITCRLEMPLPAFLRFNVVTPKLLNGVAVLPVRIKYSVGVGGVEVQEVEFVTLPLQHPYDLDEEQRVPAFNSSKYYWVRMDDLIDVINEFISDGYNYYYHTVVTFPQPISAFSAPSEADYNMGGRFHEETLRVYIYHFSMSGARYKSVDYHAWLEVKKR